MVTEKSFVRKMAVGSHWGKKICPSVKVIILENEIAILFIISWRSSRLFVYHVWGIFLQQSLIMSISKFGPFGVGSRVTGRLTVSLCDN